MWFIKKIKCNQGMSLLEVVFAVIIMSVGFLSTLFFLQSMLINTLTSDKRVMATQLAKKQMEKIIFDKKNLGYSLVENAKYPLLPTSSNNIEYTVSTNVYEVSPADYKSPLSGSKIKSVNVSAMWGNSPYQQVTLSSIVTNYDPQP